MEVIPSGEKVKVSVIIPVYNAALFLRPCIDSVLSQTMQDFEVICVDDGSTDSSLTILRDYEKNDRRIRIIQQENSGGGVARNTGLSHARGDYLIFLDADDFFSPNLFDYTYKKAINEQSDIVIYRVQRFNQVTQTYSDAVWGGASCSLPAFSPFCYQDMPGRIFNSFQSWPWNKMYRHAFVKENKLQFQPIQRTNDMLFTYSALICAKRISLLDEALVYYRYGITGSCQSTNHLAPTDFFKALLALKDFLIQYGAYNDVEQSFINLSIGGCIYNLDSIKDGQAYEQLYNIIRAEALGSLNLIGREPDYFYEKHYFGRINQFSRLTCAQYLFGKTTYLRNELSELIKRSDIIQAEGFDIRSYKLGRFMTFIPRMLVKTLRAIRREGSRATLRLIAAKIKIR